MTYGLTQISFSATIYQKVDPFEYCCENLIFATSSVVDPDLQDPRLDLALLGIRVTVYMSVSVIP
jgi:hypothetical protein